MERSGGRKVNGEKWREKGGGRSGGRKVEGEVEGER